MKSTKERNRRLRARQHVVLWIVVASVMVCSLPAPAQTTDETDAILGLSLRRVTWTRLQFSARKFGIAAESTVSLAPAMLSDSTLLLNAMEGNRSGRLQISIDSAYLGRRARAEALFDPATGSVAASATGRLGKKGYWKTYGFSIDGLDVERRAPVNKEEAALNPVDWTKIERKRVAIEGDHEPCMGMSEAAVLFYVLSASPTLKPGQAYQLCMVSGVDLFVVTIRPRGHEEVEADFAVVDGLAVEGHRGPISTLKLEVEAVPIGDPESTGKDFRFLGLEGAITVFWEPEMAVPIAVVGRLPPLGAVRVALSQIDRGATAIGSEAGGSKPVSLQLEADTQ